MAKYDGEQHWLLVLTFPAHHSFHAVFQRIFVRFLHFCHPGTVPLQWQQVATAVLLPVLHHFVMILISFSGSVEEGCRSRSYVHSTGAFGPSDGKEYPLLHYKLEAGSWRFCPETGWHNGTPFITKLEIAYSHHVSLRGDRVGLRGHHVGLRGHHVRIWNKLYVYKPACVHTLYSIVSSHIEQYSVLVWPLG